MNNIFTLEGWKFSYDEIVARDKTNLDIFWLKDKSLADLDNLPDPDILANEVIENMETSLSSFKEIMLTINGNGDENESGNWIGVSAYVDIPLFWKNISLSKVEYLL